MRGCWWIRPPLKRTKLPLAKKSTPTAQALGRSRGGLSSKLHAVVDALGNAVSFRLSGGHQADCVHLPALLDELLQSPGKVVADKAYDTNKVLAAIARHQAEAVIPPQSQSA